jgi:hypothetical protein
VNPADSVEVGFEIDKAVIPDFFSGMINVAPVIVLGMSAWG